MTALVGIPYIFRGLLIKLMATKTFDDIYWACIYKWWDICNFINPFEDHIIHDWYCDFKFTSAQIVFWIGLLTVFPFLVYAAYQEDHEKITKMEKEAHIQQEHEEREKERTIKHQQEIEEEAEREEQEENIEKRKKKESSDGSVALTSCPTSLCSESSLKMV